METKYFDYFDILIIICLAVIFKYSGNIDFILAFICAIFLFYLIKMLIIGKYNKETPTYEIKDLINIDNTIPAESFTDYDTNNNQEELENILDDSLQRVSKIPEIKSKFKIFSEYFPKLAKFVKNSY